MGWLLFAIAALAFLILYFNSEEWRRKAREHDLYFEGWKKHTEEMKAERERLDAERRAFDVLVTQKSVGFPYLADAWKAYLELLDRQTETYLRYKGRAAPSAADKVKEYGRDRREYARKAKILEYKLKLYESLFPWLTEYGEEGIDDALIRVGPTEGFDDGARDPVEKWLPSGEYATLSVVERNQRALDRYLARQKTKWEIGRDFERFVGFLYERDGFEVQYMGALEGLDDLGRDLIARRGDETKIIQCKYWSEQKTIHEKHIFQLLGTTLEFMLRNGKLPAPGSADNPFGLGAIEPVLFTSTNLSDRARSFASALRVTVREGLKLQRYPIIKCNIGRRGKAKIYHLPFDQQYDRVQIERDRGELYVSTVAEAEQLGFRRALKWRGTEAAGT